MSTSLPHDEVVPFKLSDESKTKQIALMFDRIAFRYDFLNHFLSCGIDMTWRKKAIKELADLKPQSVLDVATGTGDMALLLHRFLHPKRIVGIDISEGMLRLGVQKVEKQKLISEIDLLKGDVEAINFANDSFDAITSAFGVRNFEHLEKGLKEMLRVLKPGGKLVILEFSKPRKSFFKGFYQFYMNVVARKAGKWLSKNKDAYQYLTESVKAFPDGDELLHILNQTGYTGTYLKTLSLGICTIYCGSKRIS
ncbi:MAG TPA: bifunctional demethylmenaquinone methyltransferase/2-methoxy-6-polyprenyl-1,4-benzoquinol methylase UbiE [Chitinophagaceae bacterium]|nr:bifunctional demethylmenaquinone methyltransferase/2-methoxy-6-polyprenyl-1,4-benzoquinol methylase UbiE [Chitinophagaceae bacterium]